MMEKDAAARTLILAKLAQSRAELRALLDPPRPEPGADASSGARRSEFPRSRTMQTLLSSRGLGAAGALIGGLLIARPALALRVLRMVPASAVGKMLLVKAMEAFKSHRDSRAAAD
jgi:anti-sigma factor RsiW